MEKHCQAVAVESVILMQMGRRFIFSGNPSGSLLQLIQNHPSVLIIVIGILIRLPLVIIPEFYGFQDANWRQTDTASIAHNFYAGNPDLLYPQIHWGGHGPGYVETEFQLYPFVVAMLYRVFGEHIAVGLALSLLISSGTMMVFYWLANSILPPRAAAIALAFFVVSPLYIQFSVVFMPEPTVLFFYVAALYFFLRWLNRQSFTALLLAASSTALAILVKPTSIHIGFVFLALVIHKYGIQFIRQPHLWLFAAISLLPGIVWYLHARNLYLIYGNTFGIISGGDSKFNNLRYWLSPAFYISLLRIDVISVVAVGGLIPFVIGTIQSYKNRSYRLILYGVASILIYYMLIPRYTSFADYYHIFMVPFAALGIGLGADTLLTYIHRGMPARSTGIVVGILLFLVTSLTIFRDYQIRLSSGEGYLFGCSKQVARVVPENTLVIISTTSASEDNGVPNNYQEPNIFFYSNRYGWSLPADWHTPEQVAEYREAGGQYFIIYDQNLLSANPRLQEYLDQNAEQTGPGVDNGCGIYRFEGSE